MPKAKRHPVAMTLEAAPTNQHSLKLETGVVLKLKKVQGWLIREAMRGLEEPQVPIVHIEEKGRSEENPSDPDYLDALRAYNNRYADKIHNVLVALGTEIQSMPKGFPGPDATDWQERLEAAGIEIEVKPTHRYVQWIKLIAFEGRLDEFRRFMAKMGRLQGVTEEDVAKVEESFRDIP